MTTYTLTGPTQSDTYQTYQLFEHVDGIFSGEPREFATADIHVGSNSETYIMIPSVPQGVRANSLEHAINFCKGVFGITTLLTSDAR